MIVVAVAKKGTDLFFTNKSAPFSGRRLCQSDLDDGVAVTRQHGIMRHQPHGFGKRLCDQQAVEGILVMRGQRFDAGSMLRPHGKQAVAGVLEVAQRVRAVHGHVAAAEAVLDGDFPDAGGADPDHGPGRFDQLPRFCGKPGAVGDGPERDRGVQQQVHAPPPRNSRATSSACASMSSGTSKRPRATPMRGPGGASASGTSRAAGRPLRAMMISRSRPCSMSSTRRDSEDLACSMLTELMADTCPEFDQS